MKNKLMFWLVLIAALLSVGVANAQETEIGQIVLGAANADQFPVVAVPVTVWDENGRLKIIPPDPNLFLLSEDDQTLEQFTFVPSEEAAPRSIFIVIEQGQFSIPRYRENYDESALKDLFLLLGEGYFREGVDNITILAGRNDADTNLRYRGDIILPTTQTTTDLADAVRTFDLTLSRSEVASNDIEPVETPDLLLDALDRTKDALNPVIIYMSAVMHAPQEPVDSNRAGAAARRIAREANKVGVSLYILQTAAHLITDDRRETMEIMADETNGGYVELKIDSDNEDTVAALYDTIWQPGGVYTISFRSQSGATDAREITLAPRANPAQVAQTSYQVAPAAPTFAIFEPDPTIVLDRAQETLDFTLELAWPDGNPRTINEVRVDGIPVANPIIDGDRITFQQPITIGEAQTGSEYELTVVDELGLTAVEDLNLPIATSVPPSDPPLPQPDGESGTSFTCSSLCQVIVVLTIGGLVALIAFIAFKRFPRTTAAKNGPRKDSVPTIIPNQQLLGTLEVLAGRQDFIGETIALNNEITTIGRDNNLSDVQIFNLDDRSSVSGQHCTIQYDKGKFWIIDNGSSNGTTVNGRSLTPDTPCELKDSDEIILGEKARRGAHLRFHFTKAAQNMTITDEAFAEKQPPRTGSETQLNGNENKQNWIDRL